MMFSIVVVALNPGADLEKTLRSIASQTYPDYEVILKDGGSTDGSMDGWRGCGSMQQESMAVHTGEVHSEEGAEKGPEKGPERGLEKGPEKVLEEGPEEVYGADFVSQLRLIERPDTGIYDAMNQAVEEVKGEYILFLNCGDTFASEDVLERVSEKIYAASQRTQDNTGRILGGDGVQLSAAARRAQDDASRSVQQERTDENFEQPFVFYGDTFSEKKGVLIVAPPKITGFTCYRNIPCHQSCFYSAALCRKKLYDLTYHIRADYDHFLWCFYEGGAKMVSLGFPISSYEGGGFSEKQENKRRDFEEHREITRRYMSSFSLFKYRFIMALTLAPLRRKLAEGSFFSGAYERLKAKLYR